jgi:hypothetical protein
VKNECTENWIVLHSKQGSVFHVCKTPFSHAGMQLLNSLDMHSMGTPKDSAMLVPYTPIGGRMVTFVAD